MKSPNKYAKGKAKKAVLLNYNAIKPTGEQRTFPRPDTNTSTEKENLNIGPTTSPADNRSYKTARTPWQA